MASARSRFARGVCLLALVSAAPGCGGWERQHIHDEGHFCLLKAAPTDDIANFDDPGGQHLSADAPLFIRVIADSCLNSCTRNPESMCEAQVVGSEIVINSEFSWDNKKGNVECTTDCRLIAADCQIPTVPTGHYTVRLGKTSRQIDVPGTVPDACM